MMTHRCKERNTDVDVEPGEEDGERGMEGALCNININIKGLRATNRQNQYHHSHLVIIMTITVKHCKDCETLLHCMREGGNII